MDDCLAIRNYMQISLAYCVQLIQLLIIFVYLFQIIEKGTRFTMRDGTGTLGYGVVTELKTNLDPDHWEKTPKREKD